MKMRRCQSVLVAVLALAALPWLGRGQAKPEQPAAKIGVYDSRAVAIAYGGSPCMEEKMAKLKERMKAAKEAGAADEIARLETEGKSLQAALHKQAFSGAPVDDLLHCLPLPDIQKEAGVARLVSKWNKAELEKYSEAKTVDVTMALVDAFHPKPKQRQYAVEIQKSPLKELKP